MNYSYDSIADRRWRGSSAVATAALPPLTCDDVAHRAPPDRCEPPLHPRAFAARLARTVFTNGKSDCELVASLYADTLCAPPTPRPADL